MAVRNLAPRATLLRAERSRADVHRRHCTRHIPVASAIYTALATPPPRQEPGEILVGFGSGGT